MRMFMQYISFDIPVEVSIKVVSIFEIFVPVFSFYLFDLLRWKFLEGDFLQYSFE